ncbi:MAG: hypothetical protein ABH803_01160 [Candidatus Micrarchaeota archaeon]
MSKKRGQQMPAGGSFFESAIPLILIVVLGLFIAARFGYLDLSGVPLIGSLVPSSSVDIAVIGNPSQVLVNELRSRDATLAGIKYMGHLPQEAVVGSALDKYDLIILQGEVYCDRTAREAIRNAVQGGTKLLVVGNACTRVHNDKTVYGWDFVLKDVIPVKLSNIQAHEPVGPESITVNGKLTIVSQDHQMFMGILNPRFSGTVTSVYPAANADILALVSEYGSSPVGPSEFAIMESKGLLSGKTMYFAFDPGTMIAEGNGGRNMFIASLLYLNGKK